LRPISYFSLFFKARFYHTFLSLCCQYQIFVPKLVFRPSPPKRPYYPATESGDEALDGGSAQAFKLDRDLGLYPNHMDFTISDWKPRMNDPGFYNTINPLGNAAIEEVYSVIYRYRDNDRRRVHLIVVPKDPT
jgi:hypothetical protein